MQTLTTKDAEHRFSRLIDLARAAPIAVAKHGLPVVVVMAVEEYERLKALATSKSSASLIPSAPKIVGEAGA